MTDRDDIVKPKNWLEALNCAIEGVIYAFKTQRHIRYHYVIAAMALVSSLVLRLPMLEFVVFAISVVVLLFAEMLNTAIEETVNLLEDKKNLIAKNAKDVAAGAVLISSIAVLIVSYMIFTKHLYGPMAGALEGVKMFAGHVAIVALLLVLIAVVVVKAAYGKGRPLHGGLPSGHAAVAFSLFTSISLLTLEPFVVMLAFVMATMVSHSRLIGAIHTKFEIFLGALLGLGLTLLVFFLFNLLVK
ncbi:MAG: diacylglycerol kinase [Deltaproteobacteria bacterium]|nr:diacylglycerol kinase [Deltaproteobacteria bacterium]